MMEGSCELQSEESCLFLVNFDPVLYLRKQIPYIQGFQVIMSLYLLGFVVRYNTKAKYISDKCCSSDGYQKQKETEEEKSTKRSYRGRRRGEGRKIKRKTGEREGERMRDISYIVCRTFKTELTSVMMDYEWLLFVLNAFCIIRGQMNSLL